jgi:MoxR-like ATPase
MDNRQQITRLQESIAQSIIGQEHVVSRLVIGLLANGNLLLEGLPGLAKTRAVKSLAKGMETDFSRIQFTPDLLPADVTGTEVMYTEAGGPRFRFEPGPIFANIVLADEINRAPAKVQAALLEAMEERQVTVAGTTHKMPDLFMVMATQNPVEQEGTYPLPEAQMDRFLMHIYIDYPDEAAEGEIIRLVRGEEQATVVPDTASSESSAEKTFAAPEPVAQQAVFDARAEIAQVIVSDVVERYMVDLVFATRYPERYNEDLSRWIQVGASPRGALALDRCARARAWLAGRDLVLPEDVHDIAPDCLRHRLMLSYEASAEGISANAVVDQLLQQVAVA